MGNDREVTCRFISFISFTKNHNRDSDKEDFLDFDIEYKEELLEFYNDLPFKPKGMKFKKLEDV